MSSTTTPRHCTSQTCTICHPPTPWGIQVLLMEYAQGRMEVSVLWSHIESLRATRPDLADACRALTDAIRASQQALREAGDAFTRDCSRVNEVREQAAEEARWADQWG